MIETQEAVDRVNQLIEALEAPGLAIDPERTDWSQVSNPVDEVRKLALDALKGLREVEDAEERRTLSEAAAWSIGRAGALLHNAGQSAGAGMLRASSNLDPDDPALRFGRWDPEGFVRLSHALILRADGDVAAGDAVLKRLLEERPNPDLDLAVKDLRAAGTPVKSAPPLFTLNGFGTKLYGQRDERPDGSYVTTLCICLLFIPTFPLMAYRVIRGDDGGYGFISQVPLSRFARAFRNGLLALVLVGVGAIAFEATWNAPGRQAARAYSEAEALAAEGPPERAAQVWQSYLAHEHIASAPDLAKRAARSLMATRIAAVATPFTADRVAEVERIVAEYRALSLNAQSPSTTQDLVEAVRGWAGDVADPQSKVVLLRVAMRLTRVGGPTQLKGVRKDLEVEIADFVREEQPLEALELYTRAIDREPARRQSAQLIDQLAKRWTVLLEERALAQSWASAAAEHADTAPERERLRAASEAAEAAAANQDRKAILQTSDAKSLERYLAAHPDDAEVAIRVASLLASRGRLEEAERLLVAHGPAPWLTSSGQTILARIWASQDRRLEAERLLEGQVARRVPKLQAARGAYSARIDAIQQSAMARAERGDVPPDLKALLQTTDEKRIREAFSEWVTKLAEVDAPLATLREAYQRESSVVDAAVDLGGLRLQRANAASGPERERLLAEAERAFLSVGEESQGMPAYHLGLGTTYYRLEKRAEGDREFAQVLGLGEPQLSLAVARAYRALGLEPRAKEIATQLYEQNLGEVKNAAAALLALLADTLEEKQRWLRSSGTKSTGTQAELASVDAELALREGDVRAAAKHFQRSYDLWKRLGDDSTAAINNRALSMERKFGCSGRMKDYDAAVQDLALAARLEPDSALVVSNYAHALFRRARLRLLARWVKLDEFPLDEGTALALLSGLKAGPHERQVRSLVDSPDLQEAQRMSQRGRTLAPARSGGYSVEAWIANYEEDPEGLASLLAAARHSLDPDRPDESGSTEDAKARISGSLRTAERWVARAKDPETKAAALLHLSHVQAIQGQLTASPDSFAKADKSVEAAQRAWPALDLRGTRRYLASAEALTDALRDDPALSTRFVEQGWGSEPVAFALVLQEEGNHDAVLARLEAHPRLRAAVAIAKQIPASRPAFGGWALGKLARDDALMKHNRELFTKELHRLDAELDKHLYTTVALRARARLYAEATP